MPLYCSRHKAGMLSANLRFPFVRHREVYPQKWISKIWHGVNVRPQYTRGLIRIEIETFERQNTVPLQESELPGYLIRVQPRCVDHIASFILTLRRLNCATCLANKSHTTVNLNTIGDSIGHHRLEDRIWVNR